MVQYDQMSSRELHDLAVRHARRHVDIRFFWQLMEVLPAAQAAAGDLREAEADVVQMTAHLNDITDAGAARLPRCCGRSTLTTSPGKDDVAAQPALA